MNYKDVALLNGSLDQLGDTLLKQKMMEQQGNIAQGQIATANRRADAADQHYQAQQEHYNSMETRFDDAQKTAAARADAQSNSRLGEVANRTFSDSMKMIGGWVKDGIMDPEKANATVQQQFQNYPDAYKAAIATHPLAQALAAGQPVFQPPANKPGFQTAPIANKRAYDMEMGRAEMLESNAQDPDVPDDEKAQMQQQAKEIREEATKFYVPGGNKPATEPTPYTVETGGNGQPKVTQKLTTPQYQQMLNQKKAARANQLFTQNPKLTRQQIFQQVEQEFSGGGPAGAAQ